MTLDDGNQEGLDLLRQSLKSVQVEDHELLDAYYTFVVFGASGDLAKKKIYPTLWALFKENLLPPETRIIGYARSKLTVDQIRGKCHPFLKVKPEEESKSESFWSCNLYVSGGYDDIEDFKNLNEVIANGEKNATQANRDQCH